MFQELQFRLLSGNQSVSWGNLLEYFSQQGLNAWARQLTIDSQSWLHRHGDYPRWAAALETLPVIDKPQADFNNAAVTVKGSCEDSTALQQSLRGLMPWRKGPYQIADISIDCEWRSDIKWDRILPHLAPLQNRRILDIGCGNGYHCWRMLAQSPELVVGIEPSVLFNLQFQALQTYLQRTDIHLLPIGVEDIPDELNWFDTVFSMGVLYHRRSPLDHLCQLRSFLRPGGELCLETLVIEGGAGQVLLPRNRYARMRNVWFIPSSEELVAWLQRCGFDDVRLVNESITGVEEQRSTEWMQFESLSQCLSDDDPALTVEGLPAPRRAVVLANKPA
ncbi:MAG: tRNA 5-methoxyuridine(34)/uridine 5-oxyacetic acid(34) synthase CmoB [Gammaproteobacteria bacterium]|nr:tRNA 5-methoxyuridine(34)/uridine 5-oxyacetic acid(34) synthase CmoB [Gammaproteobacteria bacterium]